ncbi:MAG: hypothetical protein ACRD9R_20850, partial [Pyrinomonadaceae bacterium]
MKTLFTWSLLFWFAASATAPQNEYAALKAEAERQYAAGSYARARELYGQVERKSLPRDEAEWVAFRLADAQW